MPDDTDALLDATTALVPRLLGALEALAFAGRHLHPPQLSEVVAALDAFATPLAEGRTQFEKVAWPDHLQFFGTRLLESSAAALRALAALKASTSDPNGVLKAYRAMRQNTLAVEALYPVAQVFPPVSRFFVDPDRRDDANVLARVHAGDATRDNVGVLHAANTRDERGGFSLYVPEYYDASRRWPLVMALHGGSGHGADFLWTWLREARTAGAIVAAPTAKGGTWSLMGEDVDAARLIDLVGRLSEHWRIDPGRVLLTGMSDGGTYSYLCGLATDAPFTHLAPISAAFHPMLLHEADARRLAGLPVYLVHGALDWMFPVDIARVASAALTAGGARVTYRELADLSHTYPREENARILEWFLA